MKIGTMLSEVAFENFPIIVKNSGMDFYIIDNEHGAFDYGVLAGLIMNSKLVGIPAIIRLSDNSRMNITKFMDMGATGLLLPMTNSTEDIKKVVEYAKYAPVGKRGISTTRMHTLYNPPELREYMRTANSINKIYAQIETRQGVLNSKEILSAEGVDGVFIGPNDLSCDLNCIGENESVFRCIEEICKNAKEQNKECGIITTDRDYIDFASKCGITSISYGSELNMIINSCNKIRKELM